MLRTVFLASAVYAWGHPGLSDYRPEFMDRPLVGFHESVNSSLEGVHGNAVTAVNAVGGQIVIDYLRAATALVTHSGT